MWNEKLYEKGMAIFRNTETVLYVYYDFGEYHTNYGKSFGITKNEYGTTLGTGFFNYENYFCNGDTVTIKYKHKNTEFRFKWDDAAQWFGIEKVTY